MDWNIIVQKYDGKIFMCNGIKQQIKIIVNDSLRTTDFYINIVTFGYSRLRLIAEFLADKNQMIIRDIQVKDEDRGLGYGSIAMEILLEIGLHIGVTKYTGSLSETDINDQKDPEHKNRLVHFYQKYGFTVDLEQRHIERNGQ